jgi:adenylosuccinate synthase
MFPGWRASTEGITDYEKLPKQAREYLSFVAKETGAKIGMISTGPDRDHTILMHDFIAELKTITPKA